MKRLLLRCLAFFGMFAVLVLLPNYLINQYRIARDIPQLANTRVLVVGDSHAMCDINPDLIEGCKNISLPAEPYVMTYNKLKALLPRNRGIEIVILTFSFHSLSAFNDWKFYDERWADYLLDVTYPIMSLNDLRDLPVSYRRFFHSRLRNLFLFPRKDHHPRYFFVDFDGHAKGEPTLETGDVAEVIARHYSYNGEPAGISQVAIAALDAMVHLAKACNCKLILVQTPLHRQYLVRIPEGIRRAHSRVAERIAGMGVPILDFSEYRFEDEYYMDYDHLNRSGAAIFTGMLKEALSESSSRQIRQAR